VKEVEGTFEREELDCLRRDSEDLRGEMRRHSGLEAASSGTCIERNTDADEEGYLKEHSEAQGLHSVAQALETYIAWTKP